MPHRTADPDVEAIAVSKRYRRGRRRRADWFWALREVSFEVARGETFGIVGRNGAGKSTLLKLLSGITAPTEGRILIRGRTAALIEVGSGFHPELTGRENVYLSGSILGMTRREIAAKLPSIVEFAGVGPFIDTPVKWYSSGMYVRLGFAIAAHLEPDVLLVDEVLAVGDAEFQRRCLDRILELVRQGTTILFVSHDLTAVERLCRRAALIEGGRLAAVGPPAEVVTAYHRLLAGDLPSAAEGAKTVELTGLIWRPLGEPVATSARAPGVAPEPSGSRMRWVEADADRAERAALAARRDVAPAATGEPLGLELRYRASAPLAGVVFEVTYYTADGRLPLAQARTDAAGLAVPAGDGVVEFVCPSLALAPGRYYVGATVREAGTLRVLSWWDGGTMLDVHGAADAAGPLYMPHRWRLLPAAVAR
jgi:ABC-type polysaccharide/polyol phosphate transport system ATPase subunit